ncbi:MAG: epoxyqueuosine reductase QueH [Candidatus Firestonebacteria bacterium]
MKLALHICCSVCFREPYRALKASGFEITGIYYNPNIQPYSEYLLRLNALKVIIKNENLTLLTAENNELNYSDDYFSSKLKSREDQCIKCYNLRLKKTVEEAKSRSIKYFSTTLLGSPHQKYDIIVEQAEILSNEYGVEFVHDPKWKESYYKSKNQSRGLNLYLQKYCGCIYSKGDRKLKD